MTSELSRDIDFCLCVCIASVRFRDTLGKVSQLVECLAGESPISHFRTQKDFLHMNAPFCCSTLTIIAVFLQILIDFPVLNFMNTRSFSNY